MEHQSNILLAVWMVTYNHEHYIATALESVVNQKTDFSFRLFIGEDCSTDNTRAICMDYAHRYPHLITLICTEQNNIHQNAWNIYEATFTSGAKYIAMLEGDDFWTDENKLQKQVDFLENNPDYSICFTALEVLNETGTDIPPPAPFLNFEKDTYTVEDILCPPPDKPISIPPVTMTFRNILPFPLPDLFYKTVAGDTALGLLLTDNGKARFMNEKTAVYRQHLSSLSRSEGFKVKFERSYFDLLDNFNEYTNHRYHDVVQKRLFPMSKTLLMYGSGLLTGTKRREHIVRMLKGYIKYRTHTDIKELAYFFVVLFFPFLIKWYKKTIG